MSQKNLMCLYRKMTETSLFLLFSSGGIGVRTSQFDSPPVQAMSNNNEESYKNQIRQKSRQGNCRTGESYFSGESRSSTPVQHHHVQAPLLMPPTNPLSMSQHSQEQSLLNR